MDVALAAIISLFSSLLGGALVAWVNHRLTVSREKRKKLDELRIQRRVDTWKRLERGSQTGAQTELPDSARDKLLDEFESAFAETILLGTKKEIELAMEMANSLAKGDSGRLLPLLTELRDNLRRDLDLEIAPVGSTPFFRFRRKNHS